MSELPSDKPELGKLRTEAPNPVSADLDAKSALEIARLINQQDATVAAAVECALPQIAQAIDAVAEAIGAGGRLIYVGAGTSGRIAALDAAECPPTFDTHPETVQFVMAGGSEALWQAVEANEDDPELGRHDMARRKPSPRDVVVGITASGRTPYTVAALEYAGSRGAKTVALTCNPGSPLEKVAAISIVVEVGAEVVAGSTRMKAGTAQKMVLNMITTGAMARLGHIYGNLMINVHLKNEKLVERGVRILEQAAGVDRPTAVRVLREARNSVPLALVMLKAGVEREVAQQHLRDSGGHVRKAIESAQPLSARRESRRS